VLGNGETDGIITATGGLGLHIANRRVSLLQVPEIELASLVLGLHLGVPQPHVMVVIFGVNAGAHPTVGRHEQVNESRPLVQRRSTFG